MDEGENIIPQQKPPNLQTKSFDSLKMSGTNRFLYFMSIDFFSCVGDLFYLLTCFVGSASSVREHGRAVLVRREEG